MSNCQAQNCAHKAVRTSGFCARHHALFRRNGAPKTLKELGLRIYQRACSIEGCTAKAAASRPNSIAGGPVCSAHYSRLQRRPDSPKTYLGERRAFSLRTELSALDSTRDTRKGRTGHLAVNITNDIRAKARGRKLEWSLDLLDAYKLIVAPCHYCGAEANWPKSRNGIDRVDNSIGYVQDNCVTACFTCNSAKGTKSQSEFYEWVDRISAARQRGLDRAGTPTLQAENLVKEERASHG